MRRCILIISCVVLLFGMSFPVERSVLAQDEPISIRLLESLAEGAKPGTVTVSVGEDGTFQYATAPAGK